MAAPITVDRAAQLAACSAAFKQMTGTEKLDVALFHVLNRIKWSAPDHQGLTTGVLTIQTEIGPMTRRVVADYDFRDAVALAFLSDLLRSVGFAN